MRRKPITIPVTYRALFQRVNRALKKQDEQLRTYRGGRWSSDLGDLYIVDVNRNAIVRGDVDLEALGKELGVLEPFERFEERKKS
jgi:hypothetical protein